MRKTSHDGADTSSITSGIDNETKKSVTSFNKMKKSSIKRKVQSFSHESDDGIIEPLLQTDKEKVEIANRSAKYLLNKSKTESLHEKDNKVTDAYADKCSVPIPVSSTSNMITNNVKESSTPTSYIGEAASIHNHMNTNIFNAYDASTGLLTTKNPILVEIDTSKPGRYSPSPLIFTTAKIHTDSKTKLMEPVQVTPVPILSTIEGNIVKSGVVSNAETKTISLSKTSSDGVKVLSGKPEMKVIQSCKDKTFSPSVGVYFPKSEELHSNENVKNQPNTINSLDGSTDLLYKSTTTLKEQSTKNVVPTTHSNISVTNKVNQSKEISKPATNSKDTLEKCSLLDKSNESFRAIDNKITQVSEALQNQEITQEENLKSPDQRKMHVFSKDSELILNTSVTGNKKLQRQKNAATEATIDSANKVLIKDAQNDIPEAEKDFSTKSDKVALPKLDHKSVFAAPVTLPIDGNVSSINTSISQQSKGISVTTRSSTEIKPTPVTVSASTSKVKSITDPVNLKPTLTGVTKGVPKSLSKSSIVTPQTDVKDIKELTTALIKPSSAGPLQNSNLSTISDSVKQDILSSSSFSSQSIKTEPSIKYTVTTVNTTLPAYIVSTSKTKIGSTLTSTTSAITSKPQIQKPLINVNTTSASLKSFTTSGAKSSPSTSATNGTKHTNFSKQTKSKPDIVKKDGRA